MNFVIIAEACNRLSAELQMQHPDIAWGGVRRFHNYIAHDYFGVDINAVRQSVTIELPVLKMGLQKILKGNTNL